MYVASVLGAIFVPCSHGNTREKLHTSISVVGREMRTVCCRGKKSNIWQMEKAGKAHIHAVRNNISNSIYSNHILNTGYIYRAVACFEYHKDRNIFERMYIYVISRDILHMNNI